MEELRRMNTDFDSAFPEEEKKEDSRSMLEVMREKNAKAEADLAAQKSKGESMEERKARLLTQRDPQWYARVNAGTATEATHAQEDADQGPSLGC